MVNFIRFLCVALCLCASGDVFGKKVSGRLGKELEKELKGRNLILRGSIHQNPMTYYEHGGNVYYYQHSRKHPVLFRIERDEPVLVRAVKVRDDELRIEFRSARLGNGLVTFSAPLHSPPLNRAAFDAGFALCFSTGEESEVLPDLVGNTSSSVYHVASSNHLPDADKRQAFRTHAEAEGAGMRACKLCFLRMPLVSDYATERTLALYASQQIQSMGQLATDDAVQSRAREIGQRVLDNWPVPLQGYKYRFSVMEDDEVNAYALPTGFVFVNRGLLEAAESDLEIEGVIAHEIAHVERRHSYRIYRNEKKKQMISAAAGVLVGVLTGKKSKEDKVEKAVIFGGLAYNLVKAATDVFYEGYPRSMEEEADAMAALYLERQYGGDGLAEMTRVLKKLRYYTDYVGVDEKNMRAFRSHPLLDDRIAAFTGSRVEVFDKPVRVVGRNNRGDEVVTLEMSCQRWTTSAVASRYSLDPTQILGKAYATADIGKPRKFKDVVFTTLAGRKIKLDNKEDSLIGPYEDQGFLLRGNLPVKLDELKAKGVKVNLDGAKLKWHLETE
ncbi:MAG: M48 family metalloprotease [Gemmatimonadota bacterium]|nr:M48 family metalloprotease [Gemmatimonadota bacterium]